MSGKFPNGNCFPGNEKWPTSENDGFLVLAMKAWYAVEIMVINLQGMITECIPRHE